MNILITTGIFPPDIGGPATMLTAFAGSLIKNGFKVQIITYAENSTHDRLSFGEKTVEVHKIRPDIPVGKALTT